ncbi:sugar ABC transporter permease [Bacillus manliponensis]|uniref:Sugar ABC transporter permease n=1 Tax=Bacillus manliponensis TaxID=574376 RepID=A0A073K2K2_9BACI|nr:ABC transporter permease [Bacillus manliponensis]KEK20786.1 sugar ABC transporter permease [Bacillus manliponensis]
MSFLDIIAIIVTGTLYMSAPLIFTALGGVFSERAGVVNIALEGLMLFGAFIGIVVTLLMGDTWGAMTPWIAILIAGFASAIFALLHAVASVTFRADQVVSGVAINFLALGLTVFAIKKIFGKGQTDFIEYRIEKIDIPGLSDIPVIGEIFFSNVPVTSYIAIILAFVVSYVIYKTPFGLRLRAVGEHPMAADTMGINVYKMRYIAVCLSGLFAGIGGAVFATSISNNFSATTITGQGFLALAAMIFGKWNPLGALVAALFFGFAQSLSITGGTIPGLDQIPSVFLTILPYVLTILALVGFVGKSEAPKALGIPYEKGKR